MKIKFCGAAAGVTGSCHLISGEGFKALLDCGMFQGGKAQDAQNREEFPFDPAEIDCLILSHAHIDHCGRIPQLIQRGFRGKIYCTDATADLVKIMLVDSGYIQEKEAEWENRKAERAGKPIVEPIYTARDAEDALRFLEPVMYGQMAEPCPGLRLVFNDAGHILGSAITELWIEEGGKQTKLVYTGDLGKTDRPLLRNPTIIKKADWVIMESTYGNRAHRPGSGGVEQLMEVLLRTVRRGGTAVIPSFAVGRTQELIFDINRYYVENPSKRAALDEIMFYVDSPMATSATEIFRRNAQVFNDETRDYILNGENPLDFRNLKFTRTAEESIWLNSDTEPKVILSASGMCEAGRVRHHLKHNLWDPRSSIVFVGYQAEGTAGRALVGGIKALRLFGEEIQVNAEIHNLEGFSGHADRQGLLDWASGLQVRPKGLFLVHGEAEAKLSLAAGIEKETGVIPTVINGVSEYELSAEAVPGESGARAEIAGEEQLADVKERLAAVHENLERILYQTNLAFGGDMPPESAFRINDAVLALEKDVLGLGTAVSLMGRS